VTQVGSLDLRVSCHRLAQI